MSLLLQTRFCTVVLLLACSCHPSLQTFDPRAGGNPPGADLGNTGCGLVTCAQLNAHCGPIGDGCGAVIDCGACPLPQTCGGGGTSFQCGGSAGCIPRSCADLGYDCGAIGDGCGHVLQCGDCLWGSCGGGGRPNVCGSGVAGPSQCPGGGATTVTGTVLAATDVTLGFGNPDPLFNAYVYVPSGPLQPLGTGATCAQCAESQGAQVSAITGTDGKFVLMNPPTGPSVPIVIQLGKWRRVLHVAITPCVANPLTAAQTRLPRHQQELDPGDNIPRFAVDTGNVDVVECVLRKMGIADGEFANPALDGSGAPTGSGRVHVYQATPTTNITAVGGAILDMTTPGEAQLWGSQTTLDAYDAILLPCEGGRDDEGAAAQSRLINYANSGGRVFATHYSYVWLINDAPFSSTAVWVPNTANYYGDSFTGLIDQSFPKGLALAHWLQQKAVGASPTLGAIPVSFLRHDFDTPLVGGQRWLYVQNAFPGSGPGDFPVHYSFNTPVGAAAANQCGRVVFSDFHVENSGTSHNAIFPSECAVGPMTPQEKLLEFMLFDLTSCVAPANPPPGSCTKQTCATQIEGAAYCGKQSDGCGGTIDCGGCPAGQSCGGGGTPNQCGAPNCTRITCAQAKAACGSIGDGCGGTIDCGSCAMGSCGGGGVANQCGGGIG